jgi:release factor glutamine methyltransferase
MTLRDHLASAEAQLHSGPHSDRARRDAETLLLHLTGKNRAWLLAHLDDSFGGCIAINFAGLIARRFSGEPLQYITGETEFYGITFRVTPAVLIPRPETEHLVEKVLALARHQGFPSIGRSLPDGWETTESVRPFPAEPKTLGAPGLASETCESDEPKRFPRILDIGTGSGAIAIAIAYQLTASWHDLSRAPSQSKDDRASASAGTASAKLIEVTAIDISESAIDIAKENAERIGVSIRFLQGDLFTPVAGETFDLIVSNPPYVSATDRDSLSVEVRDHEPALALFAGDDGLEVYRRLIPQAFAALAPRGFIALEIGYSQQWAVHALLDKAGFTNIEFTPDLQGIPRVAVAQRP